MREPETVIIVGSDGTIQDEGGSGTVLRGEDADRYLGGEAVLIPGIGMVKQGEVTQPLIAAQTAPDSLAAASESALAKGDVTQEEYNAAHGIEVKEADTPANKSRKPARTKKADSESEAEPEAEADSDSEADSES